MATISAIVNITAVGVSDAAGSVGTGSFYVEFNGAATDGTTVTSVGGATIIPIIANPKKMDEAVRQQIAAAILATNSSFIIDPDDIYIPFAQ